MNIAVLGGSFDPPHNGHLHVAKTLLKNYDKVILMPLFKHPFDKALTDSSHRFAMTKLLEDKNTEVSDMEILRKKTSYSIDTLNALKKVYRKDEFFWVMGKDLVRDFKKWKNWSEIKEKFGLIVVPRSPTDVSSSEIKKRIKQGQSIKNLVPKRVEEYIMNNKLYLV